MEFWMNLRMQLENKGFRRVKNKDNWYWRAENPVLYLLCLMDKGDEGWREDHMTFADFGRRFYQGAVNYTYKATLEGVPESAKIALGKYGATVVSATVNGEYAGFIGMEGGHSLDVARFLKEGENEIVLRVCASFRNLYGPHLEYNDNIPYEWYFESDKEYTADEYSFSEYGLFEDAILTVS